MDKIAVIGDYDSIYGFQTLGLSICPVRDAEEGKEKLRQLVLECGIICSQLPMQVGQKHWQSHRPHLSGGVTTG